MAPLVTHGEQTLYNRVLKPLRDTVGFHFKTSVFEDWIDKESEGQIRVWECVGTTNAGRFYRASSDALAFTIHGQRKGVDLEVLRSMIGEITDGQLLLSRMTEAAMFGFMVESGLDESDFFYVEFS